MQINLKQHRIFCVSVICQRLSYNRIIKLISRLSVTTGDYAEQSKALLSQPERGFAFDSVVC